MKSLKVNKQKATIEPCSLENLFSFQNGYFRARCPICAMHGADGLGVGLLIDPDGEVSCWTRPSIHGKAAMKLIIKEVRK